MKTCPCDNKKRYMDCCGLYIQKKMLAATPEILMRSRYSAFAEGNIPYIRKTMRGPALVGFDKKNFKANVAWVGLEVITTSFEPENPNIGYVEFKAQYKQKKSKSIGTSIEVITETIHENSQFEKIDGKWFYVSEKEF